jgi:hypothetical protein
MYPALHVTAIALHRPQRRNAVDPSTARQLHAAFAAFDADAAQRCVAILHGGRGTSSRFCAGYGLKTVAATASASSSSSSSGEANRSDGGLHLPQVTAQHGGDRRTNEASRGQAVGNRVHDTSDAAPVRAVSHALWTAVLRRHVKRNVRTTRGITSHLLDYRGRRSRRRLHARYLAQLAAALNVTANLGGAERIALFMNAYNALCVQLIVRRYRREHKALPRSIKDLGSLLTQAVWKKPAGIVGGVRPVQPRRH